MSKSRRYTLSPTHHTNTELMMDTIWLLGLFAVGLSGLFIVWAEPLLRRLYFRSRRTSTSATPPRSLSPEKSPCGYTDTLPPPRRQALVSLKDEASCRDIPASHICENILPMTADYRTAQNGTYTPTGFSVAEIKDLGDFPDYAALSGVPLPRAYHEFDIDKALPRPYRPFRWSYHQTMCKLRASPYQ